MEYLKPIEQLKARIKFDQGIIFFLLVLLGLLLIAVPLIFRGEPYLLAETETLPKVVRSAPWKLSSARIEGFSQAYLNARFQWETSSVQASRERMKGLTDDKVFSALKDSFGASEVLAANQKARSYYVLESPPAFSAAMDRLELSITRVLRIRNVALATPLTIRLGLSSAPLNEQNPFGLKITSLQEEGAVAASGEEKQ